MAEPKRALVTGASSGIGRGVACRLAQDGWHIVIHGRRQEALEETLAMVEAAGGTGEICRAEMGDMEQVAELGAAASRSNLRANIRRCAASWCWRRPPPGRS